METQQLGRRFPDTQHPARHETCVVREEAVLATFVGADVTESVADDERAPVQDAQGALRHA